MRKIIAMGLFFLLITSCSQPARQETVEATVTDRVLVEDVRPFGVNLGSWTYWGAEQLSSNIIKNPGFEGIIDGAIVMPLRSGYEIFDDSQASLARRDGFWQGARFSVRSGQDAGHEGQIIHSSGKGPGGRPVFSVRPGDPVPEPGTATGLEKDTEDELPAQWWFPKDRRYAFSAAPGLIRPGSPGVRSLRVLVAPGESAEVTSYLDTLGDRAEKMLPLEGEWALSFWAKLESGDAGLQVSFGREGSMAVIRQNVAVTGAWTNFRISGRARDGGAGGVVSLRFRVLGRSFGKLLLDDVDLRRTVDAGRPFRKEVVAALRALHPGYLRDWQGQLGDTLQNRLATTFARKSFRYRPGSGKAGEEDAETDFGYGLNDFLTLSAEVEAVPWIVIPPVFSDSECAGLGTYLSSVQAAQFREVIVEFGNESWNDLFRAGGIPEPVTYAQAANRCFVAVRQHAAGVRLRTAVGVQFANPEGAIRFARESREADVVSFAPYFLYSLPGGLPLESRLPLLFQPEPEKLERLTAAIHALRKEAAVYEVNLHTTGGDATAEERKPVTAGMAAGTALASNMMASLAQGVRKQCIYTLAGFDHGLDGHHFSPLWGIVRDLGPTRRFRPTGLALQLMNGVLGGNLRALKKEGPDDVSIYALASEGRPLTALALSGSEEPREVLIHLPEGAGAGRTWGLARLTAASLSATNEDAEQVTIEHEILTQAGKTVSFVLQPWSMAVLTAKEKGMH